MRESNPLTRLTAIFVNFLKASLTGERFEKVSAGRSITVLATPHGFSLEKKSWQKKAIFPAEKLDSVFN